MSVIDTFEEKMKALDAEIKWIETILCAVNGTYGKIDAKICVKHFTQIKEINNFFGMKPENVPAMQGRLHTLVQQRTTLRNQFLAAAGF